MEIDYNVVEAIEKWLANPPTGSLRTHQWHDPRRNFGVTLHPDGVTAWPGGLTLLHTRRRSPFVMPLDYAFDLPDRIVDLLRQSVIAALENRGVPFLPVSAPAFGRVGKWDANIALVDRVGLQCVFTIEEVPYLSGYDANETPPLYFLARLPHSVASFDEGLESLKPQSVKEAERLGIQVLRQGDMFAIRTPFRDLDETSATEMPSPGHGLYGTAHYATKMARLAEGTMLGRGEVVHDPEIHGERRAPDHQPLTLPDGVWWLIVRNTVPVETPPEPVDLSPQRVLLGAGGGGGAGMEAMVYLGEMVQRVTVTFGELFGTQEGGED